ncbi:GGDEF domain-containing protein [Enterobacterales bacterium CwR94]|nr:GGDEF domain-containing protein [Enterobacterales bacterium CwR94]
MKFESYDGLLFRRYRLSLMLFLFLNTASAIFSMIINTSADSSGVNLPLLSLATFGLTLITWLLLRPKWHMRLLNIAALVTGLLWSWQIVVKYETHIYFDQSVLIVSIISLFLISTIALNDQLLAFLLHAAPSGITVLWLDDGRNLAGILFTLALPLIGISLHHFMSRRQDAFTRELMQHLHREKETYSDLSMLDPLTGLYNRRGLENRMEHILTAYSGSHYVLLLDIDHFKAYNDNYGHAMGDQALARVSVAIRDAVRSRDIVVRYGGEEFLVLLTNVNPEIARKLAERIRQSVLALEIPHLFNDKVATHVTVSAGFAPLENNHFSDAVANADRALYVAKNRGRNTLLSAEEINNKHPFSTQQA